MTEEQPAVQEKASVTESTSSKGEVYVNAAAFYVSLVKNGYGDEAAEFAEWFLDTFDLDLET